MSAKRLITVSVYVDDGRVFEYLCAPEKGREHAGAIVATGYRSVRSGVLEWYPPHRITKVKVTGQDTSYTDTVRGT